MKKTTLRRIAVIATAAALCAGSAMMFAGCTSNYPTIRVTYMFEGETYEVDYTLNRIDAPNTVTHFLELAAAGYFDGMCIHDYDGTFMYSGGYTLSEDGSDIEAVDYFTEVKRLELEEGFKFTQSVWKTDADNTPLYTVYGEFTNNGNEPANGNEYYHKQGALVMYYASKGDTSSGDYTVKTVRNDGGKNNDGINYDTGKKYSTNSATSLFYTYLGSGNATLDKSYCVFGMASDYSGQLQPLITAINTHIDEHTDEDADENEEYSFTTEITESNVNQYEQGDDPDFEYLRRSYIEATYNVPLEAPIVIQSIKVTKY